MHYMDVEMEEKNATHETNGLNATTHLVATTILIIILLLNVILWPHAETLGVFLLVMGQGLFFIGMALVTTSFRRIFLDVTPEKLYVTDVLAIIWASVAFLLFRAEAITCQAIGCPTIEEIAIERLVGVIYFIVINSYLAGCLYQAVKMVIRHQKAISRDHDSTSSTTFFK